MSKKNKKAKKEFIHNKFDFHEYAILSIVQELDNSAIKIYSSYAARDNSGKNNQIKFWTDKPEYVEYLKRDFKGKKTYFIEYWFNSIVCHVSDNLWNEVWKISGTGSLMNHRKAYKDADQAVKWFEESLPSIH